MEILDFRFYILDWAFGALVINWRVPHSKRENRYTSKQKCDRTQRKALTLNFPLFSAPTGFLASRSGKCGDRQTKLI
ncbi:MAG: hypothetical protein JGK24_05875 [Microcoleus sp. PH2017_29_MFU_D_A]|uniref:hypothetical protein n=1 Tax=unclassified Microcoleus TaxID=2642155 RepID=UPI001DF16DBE|nr:MULTISPECIES: hypothetical protein [unclassified Microcoleus]MCC3419947.1 hypothetical protein [Microcoleus sp. PH2017_07_MST_O_A]MCC3429270.1 hypothetical protein [Microcoleus sp. PH2017_04_SCI_O_A]MCC3440412.1 hypothetical protein [Microcoleus sp. PH2017_03_ELD_O_A]MCC3501687.1 hypothetical protein [Microcoleus sp. PH2017_19_SFW_U_A]MCC3509034.1 hypothetical protein [Microcoleus sp. PH2017_17_BER_D_A]TAE71145.1 MAG: hypothetical protein EAZ86_03910 [Oscillatoriales cyanobacterium]